MKDRRQLAMDVESRARFIHPDQWGRAPSPAREIAESSRADGYPTAIAQDRVLGWCVLSCGQGPVLIYVENEECAP